MSCSHPALDGCACGVCDGCSFYGRSCFNGEQFPNPADRCQLCSCSVPSRSCFNLRLTLQYIPLIFSVVKSHNLFDLGCGKYQNLGQNYRILSPFHIYTLSELLRNGPGVYLLLSAHTCRHRSEILQMVCILNLAPPSVLLL